MEPYFVSKKIVYLSEDGIAKMVKEGSINLGRISGNMFFRNLHIKSSKVDRGLLINEGFIHAFRTKDVILIGLKRNGINSLMVVSRIIELAVQFKHLC